MGKLRGGKYKWSTFFIWIHFPLYLNFKSQQLSLSLSLRFFSTQRFRNQLKLKRFIIIPVNSMAWFSGVKRREGGERVGVLGFLRLVVAATMGCFFGCLRVKEPHSRHKTTPVWIRFSIIVCIFNNMDRILCEWFDCIFDYRRRNVWCIVIGTHYHLYFLLMVVFFSCSCAFSN